MIKCFFFTKKLLVSAKTYCEERMKNPAAKLCDGEMCFSKNQVLFLHKSSDLNSAVGGQSNHVGSRSIGFNIDFKFVGTIASFTN